MLSLPQPEHVVVGRLRPGGMEGVLIRVLKQRPSSSDCAARNSRAQGAPRFFDFAPPARCAAHGLDRVSRDPFSGNYRRPPTKCLTTIGGSVIVWSSLLAATCSTLHIARCGARSNRRSQATVPSPLLKPLPGCLFGRRHVREADNRIGLRFGPRPVADPPMQHHRNRHAATATRLSDVDASGAAPSAPISVRQNSGRTTTSTLRMGRRIMAERRRSRAKRDQQPQVRDRAKDSGSTVNDADASLRVFVRALARQAARECFKLELKQRPKTIQ